MTPRDPQPELGSRDQPRQLEWIITDHDDPLKPARGCLWSAVIALGFYALATTVAVIIMAVNQ